ncbi:hypothetical protein PPL_09490 [Heterostelium album PN500]|uniref:Uncharacterized protein n=1 Tax=Heterostelium pallidum (strain ATCC 26659 / Pp 5 / PN500) TaxID=670386 RepID=D3BN79_HETP5|nr:hypothetical protein PPL_09490 [Heterostelium album PN500]EFA76739.1 hypothetical protein PPL_09490 [Heterostelium album PN500]|eukprot:XP_020428871.1 hypothetical protein PPL_09490 [Heterostelium album PN500]
MLASNSLRHLQVKVLSFVRQNPKTTFTLVAGGATCDYLFLKRYFQQNTGSKI